MPSDAPPPTDARPAWLPEKFKDAEQMATAYAELEKRLGSGQRQPEAVTPEAEAAPPSATVQEARADLEKAGLSFDKYSQEVIDRGGLSDESYAELAKAGYSREMVDRFYEGQAALASQREVQLKSLVSDDGTPEGGTRVFNQMREWAAGSLTATQKAAFNEAVARGDDMAALAIQGLYAQWRAANPAEPSLIQGRSVNRGVAGYESKAQMVADMRDPRYEKDPAYRRQVEARVSRSRF